MTPPRHAICDLFSSMQGEGARAGEPMLFVRFWGCPLTCPWCDEPRHRDPAARRFLTCDQLVTELAALTPSAPTVLLTGGEPLIVPALVPLIDRLHREGYGVALETSGVGAPLPANADWITLSPKSPLPATHYRRAHELKYVVGADLSPELAEEILTRALQHPRVFVQPRARGDRLDDDALRTCATLLQRSRGKVGVSLQWHKILGLP